MLAVFPNSQKSISMPKVKPIRCIASNPSDKIVIETEVNVTADGQFTTTLKPSDVEKIKKYGLTMSTNRAGREGFFCSDTYEGLRNKIEAFLNECISREIAEQRQVIKYRISTNCHYVQGDKKDGYAIYPNGSWLPKHLRVEGGYCRWQEGTDGSSLTNKPYSLSLYVQVFDKTTYRYKSGKTVTEYEPCFRESDGRSSVDYLIGTVKMGPNNSFFSSQADFMKHLDDVPEIEATEENARVFVEILQFICKANGLLKQLTNPDNIQAYIQHNLKLQLPK